MQLILLASVWHYFFGFLLFFIAVFLIGLVLLQRGRGGGLAGALGGAGGQSAFGSKTGDVFTKITIIVAGVWIIVCLAADKVLVTSKSNVFGSTEGNTTVEGSKGKSSDKSDDGKADEMSSDAATDNTTSESSTKDGGTTTPEAEATPPSSDTPESKPDATEDTKGKEPSSAKPDESSKKDDPADDK